MGTCVHLHQRFTTVITPSQKITIHEMTVQLKYIYLYLIVGHNIWYGETMQYKYCI